MTLKTRLMFAAAILAGSATVAMAQSWPYDQTPDRYLSYGPIAPSAAHEAAPASQGYGADTVNVNDQTGDQYLSYGVRAGRR